MSPKIILFVSVALLVGAIPAAWFVREVRNEVGSIEFCFDLVTWLVRCLLRIMDRGAVAAGCAGIAACPCLSLSHS